MDPVNPWLDPAEVRRMADRLLKPQADEPVNLPDAGFDARFVGFADDEPLHQSAPRPAPTQVTDPVPATEFPPAPEAPEISATSPAAAPPAPAESPASDPAANAVPPSPRGPFLDRISRFRDWLHEHFSATGVFILDREGAVIFDESGHGKLHFLARSLALASRRPGGAPGNVHVKVGSSATLEVIPVDSPYGCLVLGAVVPHPLPPAAVSSVMQALAKVASPPGGHGG